MGMERRRTRTTGHPFAEERSTDSIRAFTIQPVQSPDMLRKLGVVGIVGVLLVVAGLATIAYVEPIVAAGMAGILVGLGLVVGNVLRNMLASFGLGGMM